MVGKAKECCSNLREPSPSRLGFQCHKNTILNLSSRIFVDVQQHVYLQIYTLSTITHNHLAKGKPFSHPKDMWCMIQIHPKVASRQYDGSSNGYRWIFSMLRGRYVKLCNRSCAFLDICCWYTRYTWSKKNCPELK